MPDSVHCGFLAFWTNPFKPSKTQSPPHVRLTRSGPKIPAADQLEGEASFGFLVTGFFFASISTSLEHPTISTLLEHPKYGCSNEVLFFTFLALKMAFKVNFDPTIGFLVSNMSSMPSFRSFGGLIWPSFEL